MAMQRGVTILISLVYVVAAASRITDDGCGCTENGNIYTPVYAEDCSKFTQAVDDEAFSAVPVPTIDCPAGLQFNIKSCVCDWPYNTECPASCSALPECPEGWVFAPMYNKCLLRSPDTNSWTGARDDCQSRGGDLAQFSDLETLIEGQTLLRLTARSFWVGVIQRTAGDCDSYTTLDGVSIPTGSPLWTENEPNNCETGGDKCVSSRGGLYADFTGASCEFDIVYVCELSPLSQ